MQVGWLGNVTVMGHSMFWGWALGQLGRHPKVPECLDLRIWGESAKAYSFTFNLVFSLALPRKSCILHHATYLSFLLLGSTFQQNYRSLELESWL